MKRLFRLIGAYGVASGGTARVWTLLDDEQWAKIAPHLPANQPGPERKDDRLVSRPFFQHHIFQ
jgi:hypothetical protein